MVVLADPLLESFFDSDLAESFQLVPVDDPMAPPPAKNGLIDAVGGLFSNLVTEDNKMVFNRFTDEMGKALGKHNVRSNSYQLFDMVEDLTLIYRLSSAQLLESILDRYRSLLKESPYSRIQHREIALLPAPPQYRYQSRAKHPENLFRLLHPS